MPLFGYNFQSLDGENQVLSVNVEGLAVSEGYQICMITKSFPWNSHSNFSILRDHKHNTSNTLYVTDRSSQWCLPYLWWFSRGPVFPHPHGNLHWLHRGRNLVDCCFLGLCSLTRELKDSRNMSTILWVQKYTIYIYITMNYVICIWLITVHESQSEFGSYTLWSLLAFYLPIELKKGSASLVGPWYTTSPMDSIIRPSNRRYME